MVAQDVFDQFWSCLACRGLQCNYIYLNYLISYIYIVIGQHMELRISVVSERPFACYAVFVKNRYQEIDLEHADRCSGWWFQTWIVFSTIYG